MANSRNQRRDARDIGRDSPGKGEAKRQRISGTSGGPREARPERGTTPQPPQGSGRRGARHEHVPTERKSFDEPDDPSQRGEGSPSPERVKKRLQAQVPEGRSGAHRSRGERTQEISQQGEPASRHARSGRANVPPQPKRPMPGEEAERRRGGRE